MQCFFGFCFTGYFLNIPRSHPFISFPKIPSLLQRPHLVYDNSFLISHFFLQAILYILVKVIYYLLCKSSWANPSLKTNSPISTAKIFNRFYVPTHLRKIMFLAITLAHFHNDNNQNAVPQVPTYTKTEQVGFEKLHLTSRTLNRIPVIPSSTNYPLLFLVAPEQV